MTDTTPLPHLNLEQSFHPTDQISVFGVVKLSKRTTESDIAEYFDRFGQVVDCLILRHDGQGSSAGYASLRMKFISPKQEAQMISADHYLNGHIIKLQKMGKKSVQTFKASKARSLQKVIFAFNLPPNITENRLHQYFSSFGEVRCLIVQKEQYTNAHRGFCRLVYEQSSSADRMLSTSLHYLDNHVLQVKAFETTTQSLMPLTKHIDTSTGVKTNHAGKLEPSSKESSLLHPETETASTTANSSPKNIDLKSTTIQSAETSVEVKNEAPHHNTLSQEKSGVKIIDNDLENTNQIFQNQSLLIAKKRQVLGGFLNFRTQKSVDALFKTPKSLILLKSIYRRKVLIGATHIPIPKTRYDDKQ